MRIAFLILLICFVLFLILDVAIRIYYTSGIYLKFNSQEFNNIASPVISFLGFVGLIITVTIAIRQLNLQQSSGYFDYYRNAINKMLQENDKSSNTLELLDFVNFTDDIYYKLKKDPNYTSDAMKFKAGEIVNSNGKSYDNELGKLRLFRTKLGILLKRYELLILEIKKHDNLSSSHKDLLYKELFVNQITNYTVQLQLIEEFEDVREMKENLFIGFENRYREQLPFYDKSFYDLHVIVLADPIFKKYLNGNMI